MRDARSPDRSGPSPTVTVIVPVFNDVERLGRCLSAIAAQDYPADRLEVVVADNASTEDVQAALPVGDDRFRIVHEARRGSYAARNAAVREARGAILAFTDADCIPRPQWVSAAVTALSDPNAPDAVGGAVNLIFRNADGPKTGPELYEVWESFDQESFVSQAGFAATANLTVPADVFEKVGEFDSRLKSSGDLEWGKRLHARGFTLGYASDAVVDHPSRPTWRELTKKERRIVNGRIDLYKNPDTAALAEGSWRDTRQTFLIWHWVRGASWPSTRIEKLKVANVRFYVGLLEIVIRFRRGVFRPTRRRVPAQDPAAARSG